MEQYRNIQQYRKSPETQSSRPDACRCGMLKQNRQSHVSWCEMNMVTLSTWLKMGAGSIRPMLQKTRNARPSAGDRCRSGRNRDAKLRILFTMWQKTSYNRWSPLGWGRIRKSWFCPDCIKSMNYLYEYSSNTKSKDNPQNVSDSSTEWEGEYVEH